jgi:hypothetical protein
MKALAMMLAGSAMLAVIGASQPAWSEQKTAKACAEEWRANKDANQAKGITEKAYVAQCRTGTAAAQPAAAPAAAAAKSGTEPKTAKACAEEWRANKDANQAKGITERAYVAQCRTGTAALQPAAAPAAPAPTTGTAPTHPAPAPERAAVGALGLNQFGNEAQARGHCPKDTVVWVNLSSNIYHFAGSKDYGTTKHGAYMCEKDTTAQGMRPAKNEKHPG